MSVPKCTFWKANISFNRFNLTPVHVCLSQLLEFAQVSGPALLQKEQLIVAENVRMSRKRSGCAGIRQRMLLL